MTPLKKWLAIAAMLMGPLVMSLSFPLINVNLDSIQDQLGGTVIQLQWIINTYGIFIASFLVTMGRLGDIFGRKRIYLIGLFLFLVAMVGDGAAHHIGVIIGFQVLYGLAGAILLPISQALLVEFYPDEKKSVAIGLWASSGGITMALGPLIGGFLLNYFSWRSIFWVNVPFALAGILLTGIYVKESKTEGESTKIDWIGSFCLIVTIGSFIMATVQMRTWGPLATGLLYGLSLASFVSLLYVEKKVEMPIIREPLFKSPMFLFCSLGNFCMIFFFWAGIFLIPLYLQQQLHYTPLQTGLMMLGFSVPLIFLSPLTGHWYAKVGPKVLIITGFVLMSLSALLQLQFYGAASPPLIAFAIGCLGMGIGFVLTPTTTGALSVISRNFAGIASGTFVTIQEIGGSLGLAITVAVVRSNSSFATGYHKGMWLLFGISLLGILSALLLPKKPKYKDSPEKVAEQQAFLPP